MEIITLPERSYLYRFGEVPAGVYYLVDGQVEVSISGRSAVFEFGTFGEWSLFDLQSEEDVVTASQCMFYFFKSSEFGTTDFQNKVLSSMVESTSKRLLLADKALACCENIPEYSGADKLRVLKRFHHDLYRLDDPLFRDYVQVKRFYAGGYYREALSLVSKLMAVPAPEELRKEFLVWHTLLSILVEPERVEHHMRKLNPKEFADSLSYAFLYTFVKGGTRQELLEMFMKTGLFVPPYTVITVEGETAREGFLVLKGYLKAVKILEDREVLLSIVKPGEFVGEGALLEEQRRMVTLYSISPACLIPIGAEQITKFAGSNPSFLLKISESQLRRMGQVKQLINIKNMPNKFQRANGVIGYFEEVFAKAKITARDLATVADVPLELMIEELNKRNYRIAIDGTVVS